ncbi:MAG: S46 family peptidase [Bacteroidaceae bacterium]|nr:S46 family peptidase [Bacteroidaceae bacterium]
MKAREILAVLLLGVSGLTKADEGMWMLNKIDEQTAQAMKELGLELTPRELYNPDGVSLKDAVVDFGDFCSGVVVSPKGLVFTNHHCGYGAIQKLSTPEDDILKNGFVARSYEEERPAEGLFVRFLQRTEECSSRVMRALDEVYRTHPQTPTAVLDRQYTDSICRVVEREYSKANPGLDCQVKSYYGGNAFYVSIYKVYRDVRLVFTATETLGKFGGDTDNWMWPRQTCDFSVFRIYADKDGEPAEYSKDNVPLKAKRYARVCLDGFRPGDYCMTVGYPGSTSRYLSSYGINERVNGTNISMIDVRGKKQDVWKKWMDSDRAIAIKYASKFASSSNYWKNSIGMNKAVKELNVIGQKQQLEQDIRRWYGKDQGLTARFGTMFDELEKAYANRYEAIRAYGFFSETFLRGIEIRRVAATAASKPTNMDSTETELAREQAKAFFKDYDARVDEETMAVLLDNYRKQVKPEYLPSIYKDIDKRFKGDTKAYARDLFSHTVMTDISCVDKFIADSTLRDTDPLFKYNESVRDMQTTLYNKIRDDRQTIDYNEHLLTQAILEREQETAHYSDANFSLRLSYGFIQDYTAGSQHFDYFTPSQSLLDKAAKQGEIEDYKLEQDIISLIQQKDFGRYADPSDGDLHLCFLSNNDITGGNSGSPMFNGKGELIGLAFDGNWEAMSGDITFNPDLQRCIGVDIRFVLYLIDKWGHADRLIREMGL